MLKTLGIVQACGVSEQLPRRLTRRLGGQSLLSWVVRRVTEAMRLDGVIVLGCHRAEHGFVAELVPPDVPFFASSRQTALDRHCHVLEEYGAEAVVSVRGDDLFVDPVLIDRLVTAAEAVPDCDYAGYCSRDGRPAVLSPSSIYPEWFRARTLRRLARRKLAADEREQVSRCIWSHAQRFRTHLIPAPRALDREDVRLRVDMEEDWEHAVTIFEALGPERLEWQRVAALLDQQPALRRRMAALNRSCRPR